MSSAQEFASSEGHHTFMGLNDSRDMLQQQHLSGGPTKLCKLTLKEITCV